ARLEDVKLDRNIRLSPGAEHVDGTLISHGLIVGGDGDEHRRRACRWSLAIGLGGVDRGSEIWPGFYFALRCADNHRATGGKSHDPDAVRPEAIFRSTLAKQAYRLLAVRAGH